MSCIQKGRGENFYQNTRLQHTKRLLQRTFYFNQLLICQQIKNLTSNKMRTDAKKNLKKVATAIAKDPLATRDEIAKKTGLSQGNVSDKLTKVDEGLKIDKTDDVIRIAKTDLRHLEMIQGIEVDHIKEYADRANKGKYFKPGDLHALSSIAEKKQKRYSILMGENTGKEGEEKEFIIKLPNGDRLEQ